MTPEGLIKQQICMWLERQREAFFWVTQSVGIRGRTNNSRWSCKGVSDINGLWNARPMFIEVKAPGGKVSEDQKEFLANVYQRGAIAFVAYSLEDVIKQLKGKK